LETFQPAPEPEEEKMVSVPDFSVKHLEKDIDSYLTEFQRYSKQIDETSVRLEELSKLLKSGEISQNTYDSIADDLGRQLFSNVEEAFKIREGLEFVKAKALLECAKEKAKATEGAESTKERSDLQYVKDYRDLVESEYWTETISLVYRERSSNHRTISLVTQRKTSFRNNVRPNPKSHNTLSTTFILHLRRMVRNKTKQN